MSNHMDIINQVCGDLGMNLDPITEAQRAAWDLFHAAWRADGKGDWHKPVRVYLLAHSRGDYYSAKDGDHFWGRSHRFDAYFSVNENDCRYLSPLDLELCVTEDGKYIEANSKSQVPIFRAISKKLGVDPQFLDFKDLYLNGIELDMVITKKDYDAARKATEPTTTTVAQYLGLDGELGSKAKNAEVKQVVVFLSWMFFGLSLKASGSVEEVQKALKEAVVPVLIAKDVARARYIMSKTDDIVGSRGNACRQKNKDQLLQMVAAWDEMLRSVGVEPPHRAKELKISKID